MLRRQKTRRNLSMRAIVILGLAIVFSFAVLAYAQQAGSAAIEGRVVDATGAAVPGASISVKNTGTGATRMTESDAAGNYREGLLTPGVYEVTVMKTGFGTLKRSGLNLEVGAAVTLNLEVSVEHLNEVVTVVAEAPLANPEKVGVNDTISQTE